jgi:hypothetical protein
MEGIADPSPINLSELWDEDAEQVLARLRRERLRAADICTGPSSLAARGLGRRSRYRPPQEVFQWPIARGTSPKCP